MTNNDSCKKCSSKSIGLSSGRFSTIEQVNSATTQRKLKLKNSVLKRKKVTPGYENMAPSRNSSSAASKRQRPYKLCIANTSSGSLSTINDKPDNKLISPVFPSKRRKGSMISPSGWPAFRTVEKNEGLGVSLTPTTTPSSIDSLPFLTHNSKSPLTPRDSSPSRCFQGGHNPTVDNVLWTLPEIGGPEIYFSGVPDAISRDHWSLASSWISVIGRDLTGCLLSKDWNLREAGLKGLSRSLANTLNQHRHSSGGDPHLEKLWKTTVEVLNRCLEDKIFRVYQGALKALQTLITLTHCPCFLSEPELKNLLKPLVQKIVIKCSDGKRRIAELSYSVMSELCKGSSGELAPGKHVYHEITHLSIEKEYFRKIIFEPGGETSAGTSWQWILGVSVVLDKLLDENEEDFVDQNFILMTINFAFKYLNHSHVNVSKLCRRILVKATKATDGTVFQYVWSSLSSLDLTLQTRIKRELRSHRERAISEQMYLKARTLSNGVEKRMNLRRLKESVLRQNLPYDAPVDEFSVESHRFWRSQKVIIHPHDLLLKGSKAEYGRSYIQGQDWTKGHLLGTGAYSACFQARDNRTGTLMAVKQIPLNSKTAKASLSEVELMSKLGFGPHIIRLLGAVSEGDDLESSRGKGGMFNVFIEWMSGGSISHILDTYGAFEESVIVGYIRQLLLGIHFLHCNAVLHRDIKGANLLVDTTGHHLKIGDFGAAIVLRTSRILNEGEGDLKGTIPFMAPEVIRGENYGLNSDIWSVGCCIIEMATQKPPWNALDISNHLALIFKIAQSIEPPKIPDNLSVDCLDFLLSCLQLDQDERPSAATLLEHRIFAEDQG